MIYNTNHHYPHPTVTSSYVTLHTITSWSHIKLQDIIYLYIIFADFIVTCITQYIMRRIPYNWTQIYCIYCIQHVANNKIGHMSTLKLTKTPHVEIGRVCCVYFKENQLWQNRATCLINLVSWKLPQIARFMGQHGAHLGPVGPRWALCWPHEPCYKGQSYALWVSIVCIFGKNYHFIIVLWRITTLKMGLNRIMSTEVICISHPCMLFVPSMDTMSLMLRPVTIMTIKH